jgi:D-hydroxyproline dehydrogenase subunit beta
MSAAAEAAADVVVIGAGIVGAACAYFLSEAGVRVILVDRDFPASGTSRACDGLILLWDKASPIELALGKASARLWTELVDVRGLDCEYSRRGTILVAENADALAAGKAKANDLQAAGVRAEVLDQPSLLAMEPELATDLAGGVFFPDDAQVDARRATVALVTAAKRRGLTLCCDAPVTAIQRDAGGQVSAVRAGDTEISCRAVVCAAGVWSNEVAELVGVELPVRPRKGHILVTARVPGIISHPLLEGGYVSAVQSTATDVPQVALVAEQTSSGTLLLGSSREFVGFDRAVSTTVIEAIAARAVRFLPGLRHSSVIRSYAGLRPWSPDHLPLIGPIDGIPGFYVATGHEGAGIGLAPITGQLIASWITGHELPAFAHKVLPDRFVCDQNSPIQN